MPEYDWDPAKDEWLLCNRGMSFGDVVYHLEHGGFLADIPHPNQERYPGQRFYIVRINRLAWSVPYRRRTGRVFLYTAYPSEKFTRMYRDQLGGDDERR